MAMNDPNLLMPDPGGFGIPMSGAPEVPMPEPPLPLPPMPPGPPAAETPAPTERGNIPVTTQGASNVRPPTPPPGLPPAPDTSMLDRLRQQVMREIMPEQTEDWQRRLRIFGAGVAGAGPTDFFTGLAAGSKALEDSRRKDQETRATALRQAEEADYRRAQQRLAEAKELFDRDPNNPQNILRLAQARQAESMAAYNYNRARLDNRGQMSAQQLTALYIRSRAQAQREAQTDPNLNVDQRTEEIVTRALAQGGLTPVEGAQQQPRSDVRRISSGID